MNSNIMKRTQLHLLAGAAILAFSFSSCQQQQEELPIYGPKEVQAGVGAGSPDTLYHSIPNFAFVDQDSSLITHQTFKNSIYVADFFFTTCPSICPVMKFQMLRVYEKYEGNARVKFLSHSIDPKHDSVAVLKDYANRLGVSSDQWHFVTGDKQEIFDLAQSSYMVSALEDETVPGGVVHSGAFLLVDQNRRIRGHYDGTSPEQVDKLLHDIDILLEETQKKNKM